MIACIDVSYQETTALVACVVIESWCDACPTHAQSLTMPSNEEYVPGEFYRRELPCIERIIAALPAPPNIVVVDGFVWLNENEKPGLGAYLFRSLNCKTPVVGVAKSPFPTATSAKPLLRGTSGNPLFIDAAGVAVEQAVEWVQSMHGAHRIPTVLKLVDRMSKNK